MGKNVSNEALRIFEESSSMKAAGGDRQAPGGASTLCLGYSPEVGRTPIKLQPPGGKASICLGLHDDEVVLEIRKSGRCPPGGDATLNLGENITHSEEPEEPAEPCRPVNVTAPGGKATICL